MSSKKIFVVIGATDAQAYIMLFLGSAIARHFLKTHSDTYTIRAVTRNPSSPSASQLASLGAEVVQADLSDKSSLETAFKDTSIIFAVTDFFATLDPATETSQGTNAIDAACSVALNKLESFLWSTLPDPRTFPVPYHHIFHFNTKSDISRYLRTTPLWKVSTEIWVAAYFQNYIKFSDAFDPRKQPDGSYSVAVPLNPSTLLHQTNVDELGLLVERFLMDPTRFYKETVLLSSQTLTPVEQVRIWAEVRGVKASFAQVRLDDYVARLVEQHGFPEALALETGENVASYRDNPEKWTRTYGKDGKEVLQAKDLIEGLQDWKGFVQGADWSGIL